MACHCLLLNFERLLGDDQPIWELDAMTDRNHLKKPRVGLSQILLVAMAPMMVVIAIPLNVFLGRAVALTIVAIAVCLIIVTVLLLSRAERKKAGLRD
ncbi:hypothetical protein CI784_01415 [Arthrobacter agilis]|nr:hypothetical protein B8W74_01635 [Arthrobacter agilis]PPB47454.1 hypothetical protein CI784_01415 [Arthrobacter agilis]